MDTSHIAPTLTDTEVLEFCKHGYLLLDGVVPEEINRRTVAFVDNNTSLEPTDILAEELVYRERDPQSRGRRRRTLAAGSVVRGASSDEQPPRAHAGASARLAS